MEALAMAGNIIMGLGIVFMAFGAVAIFALKDFYPRILASSKVDTVGLLTFLLGVCLRHGFSFFSAKVLLIAIIILVLNPLVAHVVTRSAHRSGYLPGGEEAPFTEENPADNETSNEITEHI